jgi:hypothetical protein
MTGGDKIPKGYERGQLQQFTPEQMQLFQQMFGQLGPDSFLGRLAGGDQSMFEEMEAPAMRQFGQLQGGLASRFSGMGMGGQKSSGFQNTMNQAASDFAQQLQSQRLGLRNQAIQDLMGMSNQLLGQRPYEQFLTPKSKPFWQQLLMGLTGAAGEVGAGMGTGWMLGKAMNPQKGMQMAGTAAQAAGMAGI